jgi:hypothetical protein
VQPDVLPFMPDRVGSAWNQNVQIDVAAINRPERMILLGECKWTALPVERKVLQELIEKTNKIVPSDGKWKIQYILFSRNGWAPSAQAYASEVNASPPSGSNWQAMGIQLVELARLEENLAAWSH